jgi:hypothetical protein
MKKKLFIGIAVVAVAAVAAVNVSYALQDNALSALALANVEALGQETSSKTIGCWQTVSTQGTKQTTHITYCGGCIPVLANAWSGYSSCPPN